MGLLAPQASRTRAHNAREHGSSLGISVFSAGQKALPSPAAASERDPRQRDTSPSCALRGRRWRPRIAADLLTTAVNLTESKTDTDTSAETTTPVDLDAANTVAGRLARVANAGRMALHARTQAGEVAAWATVLNLPSAFNDARDELEHYADHWAKEVTSGRAEIQPAVDQLNEPQTSATSWSLPVPTGTTRGVWAGPTHWLRVCEDTCDAARCRTIKPLQASPHTTRALLRARASFFDRYGRNCTASAATIVERARESYGLTVATSTALTRLRAINRVLVKAGLLHIQVTGRHLTSIERLAAHLHHGGTQKKAANVVDATVPAHLLPDAPPPPDGPAYAEGLEDRLAARDTITADEQQMTLQQFIRSRAATRDHKPLASEDDKSSTYSCGYGCISSPGSTWVAHERAQARRANTENPPTGEKTPRGPVTGPTGHRFGRDKKISSESKSPISLRARRIADDLTRKDPQNTLASGPYAHLTRSENGLDAPMTLSHLARLIDRLTPDWAGTQDVLAGLTHAATSQATGYIALGLHTRPANPTAWMNTVLSRIDWTDPDAFPAWSTVAEAYSFHWCGNRREWANIG